MNKQSDQLKIRNSTVEFLIFTSQVGEKGIEVRYENGTIWLTQKLMAELFSVERSVVTKHLQNIFEERELDKASVCANFAHTASDGKNYKILFYNLDAIISVGYRVNSKRATQFRQWATCILREFAIKGYVLDKSRLENGSFLGEDYFERLLSEIREIRLSERRFYQKITDIYTTSIDTINLLQPLVNFLPKCRTNFIMQFMDKQPQSLLSKELIAVKRTWV